METTKTDDSSFQDKLKEVQKILIKNLIDKSIIDKWINNEEIYIESSKFKNLFCGDWNRNNSYTCNLNKFLNKKIKPDEIFNTIIKELTRKREKSYELYRANFNPNLFFLFYDKFENYTLAKDYKFYFTPIFDNDKIVGVRIGNRSNLIKNKIMREETIVLIELQSRILLNDVLISILGDDIFCKYFVINSIIQKQVKTYIGEKYVDLAYLVNECENKNPGLLNIDMNDYIYIEIQEGHHKYLEDTIRNNAILSSGKSCNIPYYINFDYDKFHNKIFKQIIKGLSKIIIKNNPNLESTVLKSYLIFVEDLDFNIVDMVIDLKNKRNTIYSIIDVVEKCSLNSEDNKFNKTKIIKKIIKDNVLTHPKYFLNITDYMKLIQDNEYLYNNYQNILLSDIGVNALLNGIPDKYWNNKAEFNIYKTEIENKYFQSIINLLKDDQIDFLIKENIMKSSVFHVVKNRNDDKWFKNVKFMKNLFHNFHKDIPYMFKEEGSIISGEIIKIFVTEEKFKYLYENNVLDDGLLLDYRIVYPIELDQIMNIPLVIEDDEVLILSSSESESEKEDIIKKKNKKIHRK